MIDLRSDTVTLPTEEMRAAMRRAELGDDSRDGDPTVRLLEEKAAALKRADEMKSHFLRYVSHEFRTPVNAVLALTQLLLRRVPK